MAITQRCAVLMALSCQGISVCGIGFDRQYLPQNYKHHTRHHHHHHVASATVVPSDDSEYDEMVKIGSDDLSFYWKTFASPGGDAAEGNDVLDVRLIYSGHAWLGIGLSEDGRLSGSQVVIGKPHHHHVKKYELTKNEWTSAHHLPADRQTLRDARIEQNATSTIMSFKQTLSTDDGGDDGTSFKKNGKNLFLFAYGENDDFHDNVGKKFLLSLDLSEDTNKIEPSDNKTDATKTDATKTDATTDANTKSENTTAPAPAPAPKKVTGKKRWTTEDLIFMIGISIAVFSVPIITCFCRRQMVEYEEDSDLDVTHYGRETQVFFD